MKLSLLLSACLALTTLAAAPDHHTYIVGGGVVGALESYYAFKDAKEKGSEIAITVFEKGSCFDGAVSTNTSCNIVPSLTVDEILSVVPRGSELVQKLAIPFNQPGGIRVDDVPGINDTDASLRFIEAVTSYGNDANHDDRTLSLLMLGKKSMELWQELYTEGDNELKALLESANFNPCREPKLGLGKALHDGYRIDLIYGVPNASDRASNMKSDYDKLGYQNCTLLTPQDVQTIDPYLADFCKEHSTKDATGELVWNNDTSALWRPGGCIDTSIFLPKFFSYLKKKMGDDFEIKFQSEVVATLFDREGNIKGLSFKNGQKVFDNDADYIFCPGESVGTLQNLGFTEPAYAAFAGPSLLITIPLNDNQIAQFQNFSHCMEVHREGIVLAWQARLKDRSLFIGVAGTKAFYGDKEPKIGEEFAKNRHLVQLNMVNDVLPEQISLALKSNSYGKTLGSSDLQTLVDAGLAKTWVGRRAVAYDGFPTLGALYHNGQKVANGRCTTHLGSGGVSFGPGAVYISRQSTQKESDPFVQKILSYAASTRSPS